jgi:adenylate cyclase
MLFAQIALSERRYDDAIALMEKSVSFAPNHNVYLAIWGRFLAYAGRPEEGLPLIQRGLRLSPYPRIVTVRFEGETYHALGRYEEALAAFERARALAPKSPIPVVWLMMTYADMGRTDEARAAAQELFKLQPKFPVKGYVSGIAYKDRTEVERRLAALRKLELPELKLD